MTPVWQLGVNRIKVERLFSDVAVENVAACRVFGWKSQSRANEEIISVHRVFLKSIDTFRQIMVLCLGHYVWLVLAKE